MISYWFSLDCLLVVFVTYPIITESLYNICNYFQIISNCLRFIYRKKILLQLITALIFKSKCYGRKTRHYSNNFLLHDVENELDDHHVLRWPTCQLKIYLTVVDTKAYFDSKPKVRKKRSHTNFSLNPLYFFLKRFISLIFD